MDAHLRTAHLEKPSEENGYLCEHISLLAGSFRRWTGRHLAGEWQETSPIGPPSPEALARLLYEAPFALVAHNVAADPIFNYGNRTALELFEMSWAEFTTLPSRLSAEPMHRDERALLMARVATAGFIDDYQGIRIGKEGRRFRIEGALVWNLMDAADRRVGQAAAFRHWTFL